MIDRPETSAGSPLPWDDPPERGLSPFGTPIPVPVGQPSEPPPAACVWLSAPLAAPLTEVGQALRTLLAARLDGVQILYVDRLGGAFPGIAGSTNHDIVLRLIDAAAGAVRRGLTTVVAYPLVDPEEVGSARRRITRLVRVSLGPPPRAANLDPIPTTCRCVRDRRVVELAFLPDPEPSVDRPDIILSGPLESPNELSREIADVLFRAGWLTQVLGAGRAPTPEGGPLDPLETNRYGSTALSTRG